MRPVDGATSGIPKIETDGRQTVLSYNSQFPLKIVLNMRDTASES